MHFAGSKGKENLPHSPEWSPALCPMRFQWGVGEMVSTMSIYSITQLCTACNELLYILFVCFLQLNCEVPKVSDHTYLFILQWRVFSKSPSLAVLKYFLKISKIYIFSPGSPYVKQIKEEPFCLKAGDATTATVFPEAAP